MNLKKAFFQLFFLFAFCYSLAAQGIIISVPERTVLVNQKSESVMNAVNTTYEYRSRLSKQEIIGFYRRLFTSQGMRQKSGDGEIFLFQKPPLKTGQLYFLPSHQEGVARFLIETQEITKLAVLHRQNFRLPQRLNFIPTYSNATQFTYETSFPPMIGVGYLTFSSVEEVSNFYLKNMPSFDWTLISSESQQGSYELFEWLKLVDPFTKVAPTYKAFGYTDIVPPLNMRGKTLKFEQDKKSCTITIYKFEDIINKAMGTIWDASALGQYGPTLIAVYYFSDKR